MPSSSLTIVPPASFASLEPLADLEKQILDRLHAAALLQQLRALLPETTLLWAGGRGIVRIPKPSGVTLLDNFDDAISALREWPAGNR